MRKGRTIATVLEIVSICDTLAITPNELLDVDDSNKYADDKFLKSNKLNIELMQMMLDKLEHMNDAEAITALSSLKGIGKWTAEMILLFCLQRPDILSYDDLAIQRGLRMLYHHRKITRELFAKYQKRYSPYGSTAAIYLWAIAGGAIEGMKDYAPAKKC